MEGRQTSVTLAAIRAQPPIEHLPNKMYIFTTRPMVLNTGEREGVAEYMRSSRGSCGMR
jgi:hypothetical protein